MMGQHILLISKSATPPNIKEQYKRTQSLSLPRRSQSTSCRGSQRSPWPRECPLRPGNQSTRPGIHTCCPQRHPPMALQNSGQPSHLQGKKGEKEKHREMIIVKVFFFGEKCQCSPDTHLLHDRRDSLLATLYTTITADAFSYYLSTMKFSIDCQQRFLAQINNLCLHIQNSSPVG